MPYKTNTDLPESVRDALPAPAQTIFREVYNNAWEEYKDPQKRRGDESREEVLVQLKRLGREHRLGPHPLRAVLLQRNLPGLRVDPEAVLVGMHALAGYSEVKSVFIATGA